jgi:hypothetical protein
MDEETNNDPADQSEVDGAPDDAVVVQEWSAFYDSDGRIYYYNGATGESSWDPPEKYNPPPPEGTLPSPVANEEPSEDDNLSPREPVEDQPTTTSQWAAYQDESGITYYYNNETGETQWDKPEDFMEEQISPTEDHSAERIGEHEQEETEPQIEHADAAMDVQELEEGEEDGEKTEPEEEIDPTAKRLADAEKALNEPDAIMEPRMLSGTGNFVAMVAASYF